MDHLLSRATRMCAPWMYILVGCLANNMCANHCGKNHFATVCWVFQPYQLVRRSTQMPCAFIDAALCAWNTLPYYLALLALSCSSRLYTHFFSLYVLPLPLLAHHNPQSDALPSPISHPPLHMPLLYTAHDFLLWLFVSYNGNQMLVIKHLSEIWENRKKYYMYILNI